MAVPHGWQELVADELAANRCTRAVFGRVSLGTPKPRAGRLWVQCYVPAELDDAPFRSRIERALAGLAARAGAPELAGLAPRFRRLPAEDWARSWEKVWKPFRAGRLCVVRPGWRGALRPADVRLELEPGAAFGTGRHASTRMVLLALQERLRPGERLLDAGTGSGILAVAAVLLGARSAIGFDVDPVAARVAAELARRNGVTDRCTFLAADFDALRPGTGDCDAVVANLYTDLLEARAAHLAGHLSPGGWFAVSGFPHASRGRVDAALAAAGLVTERERARGRWLAFSGSKADLGSHR